MPEFQAYADVRDFVETGSDKKTTLRLIGRPHEDVNVPVTVHVARPYDSGNIRCA